MRMVVRGSAWCVQGQAASPKNLTIVVNWELVVLSLLHILLYMCSNVFSVYRFMCLYRQMFTVIKPSLISWMYAPCMAICFCKRLHLSQLLVVRLFCPSQLWQKKVLNKCHNLRLMIFFFIHSDSLIVDWWSNVGFLTWQIKRIYVIITEQQANIFFTPMQMHK